MRTVSAAVYALAAFLPALLILATMFAEGDRFFLFGQAAVAASWLASALYVVFALRSPTVPSPKRKLWVVVIILGNAFVLPSFWFWYVWRPSQQAAA